MITDQASGTVLSAGLDSEWSLASEQPTSLGDIWIPLSGQGLWRYSYAMKESFPTWLQKAITTRFKYVITHTQYSE